MLGKNEKDWVVILHKRGTTGCVFFVLLDVEGPE